jgi:hypothetical protein
MKFKINFTDEIVASCEEAAYEELLRYLQEVVDNEDVSAFNFERTQHTLLFLSSIFLIQFILFKFEDNI